MLMVEASDMQRILLSAASCLIVSAASAGLLSLAERPATATSTSAAPAPASTAPAAPGTPSSSSAADEAAARHAKRTACLKNARLKKLVGAKRTSYVKECMGTS